MEQYSAWSGARNTASLMWTDFWELSMVLLQDCNPLLDFSVAGAVDVLHLRVVPWLLCHVL